MLQLYYFHGATCGLKVRLALSEKTVEYDHIVVEREFLKSEIYRKLNPEGVVPTLIHDQNIILESSIIMHYVDDAFEGPSLKPSEPLNVAQMLRWMKKADEVYLPSLSTLTYTISWRDSFLRKSVNDLQKYLDNIPNEERRKRRQKSIELGVRSPHFNPALYTLDQMVSDMETSLNQSEWLAGSEFSLAEAALIPFIVRLEELTFSELWEKGRPAVKEWWDRVQARDSYDDVLGKVPNPEASQHRLKGQKEWPHIKKILIKGKPNIS